MSPKSFTLSAALCLALAIGPATVLSAPQLGGLPLLGGDKTQDAAPTTGDSEHDAGAGYDVGIPGGPAVKFGAGTHSETHGPCGPGVSSEHDAGAGYDVGIPDGPAVKFGAGTHDAYQANPCPEIVEVPTATEVIVMPSTTEVIVETPPTSTSTYVPVMIPPTYTTPISIPTQAPIPLYTPPAPVPVHSTPFIQHPAPTAMPSSVPVFNAGSAVTPGSSFMAIALPVILGLFY
ncbi:uncharacterized protein N7473_003722 [Penicillium subrubescens]|uniref:Uncharacterized protein n=1 Tax=Penicillium subrubescens TaxID=1316194 RepID=A0A1Q5T1E7_9EURO|nr:uncharacterized protein N7473_003722 [Penicillium subrubescens]KAJ5906806.1 hypothetical protein N7473_003722 [Penicillium subrubescens]OKO94053.1 hypothetical protein PENSUB_11888 [Penicillium subrubescens]